MYLRHLSSVTLYETTQKKLWRHLLLSMYYTFNNIFYKNVSLLTCFHKLKQKFLFTGLMYLLRTY